MRKVDPAYKKIIRKFESLFLLFFAYMISSSCVSSVSNDSRNNVIKETDTGTVEITFKEYEHDFGKVVEGEKVGYVFTFENKGTASLIISSATSTCGCTVPKYDTRPIEGGGKGNLEVVFDTSGREGMQTKTITVKSNASNPVVLIKIIAEVVTNINN